MHRLISLAGKGRPSLPNASFLRGRVPVALRIRCLSSAPEEPMLEPARKGLLSLLSPEERGLLVEQKELMEKAKELTSQVGSVSVKDYTGNFLDNVVDETTFSIVVAGEFNAGKSTIINALLGKKILESGALPTTDLITIVTQPQFSGEQEEEDEVDVVKHALGTPESDGGTTHAGVIVHQVSNVPLLEDLTLIDTPGTNAVLADHTARTLRLLPTADLILFVTSADRPFPESEKALLSSIQSYRKSIVVIVNKMDILETSGGSYGSEEKRKVVDFVTDHASDLLGGRPMVIPVSSRDALSTKLMGRHPNADNNLQNNSVNNSVWERSNFDSLESFLKDSLTTETKIKTKLTNPIGQAQGMVTASLESLQKEQENLELDVATIKLLHNQYAAWKKEMDGHMLEFRSSISSLLMAEGARCDVLLNRVGLVPFYRSTLIDMKALEVEFDNTRPNFASRQSLEADLLERVRETADSIATRGRAQGQAVIEFLGKRPAVINQSLVGSVSAASRFEDTRKVLLENLSGAVKMHVMERDEITEKAGLLGNLRNTAFLSAGLQIGALASGLATAAEMVDMMLGVGGSSILALGGGLVYSQGRQGIQSGYRAAWKSRKERLDEALEAICFKELARVERRILEGVAPYTRYVETEEERLDELVERSGDILAQAHALRSRINKLQ